MTIRPVTSMPSHPRITRAVMAAVGATALASALVLAATPASAAPPEDAAAYVVGQLVDGDHVELGGYIQYGPTIDAGLGLLAAGSEPASVEAIASFMTTEQAVSEYVHGQPWDAPDAAYAGATGKLGFFVAVVGGDPHAVAGEDLVETLQGLEGNDGRFSDRSDYGDYSNVLTQAYAILLLTAADGAEPSDAAFGTLLAAQCADGGFSLQLDAGDCGAASADATGLAIQALNATDPDESAPISDERVAALEAASAWLVANRQADGSYLADGLPNVNSTGYGALGALALGQEAALSRAFLESVQNDDGGLPINPGGASDLFASAQALPALAGDSFLSLAPDRIGAAVVIPETPPTSEPPTTAPPTTAPPTSTATGTTDPTLPPTGAGDGALLAGAGVALLGAGIVTIAAARRSLGRP